MWVEGCHTEQKRISTNDELEKVEGTLTEQEAQLWFGKFCLGNPGYMVELLTGVKLDPIQDLCLRAFILKDSSLLVAGRGFSKSFMIALFCIIYALANQGVKIILASGTFRQSKACMKQIETFASHPTKGRFLRRCITKELSKSSDQWSISLNDSSITAIPLGKVRGYRANVLIADELLVVSKDILDSVLKPFLMVRQDGPLHDEITRAQKLLVERGEMKPEEIERFYQNNKFIGLSSASYKFESLYKDHYLESIKTILDPEAKGVSQCVFRLSYRLAPKNYIELEAVESMRRSMSNSMFNRELEAIFVDGNDGYFSPIAMDAATVPQGQHPTVKVVGDLDKKYILAIDPNYSNSETSDDFSMCLIELNEEDESAVMVHGYNLANSTNEKRAIYLKYLLEHFDIQLIVGDNSGTPAFFQICREFKLLPKPLELFEHDFLNTNYEEGLAFSKENYKPEEGKIILSQPFGVSNFIRLANENLQWMIERKKIKFAAAVHHESDLSKVMGTNFPIEILHYSRNQDSISDNPEKKEMAKTASDGAKIDFVEHLADMINLTKKECSLIELSTSSSGSQTYDLPSNLRRDDSVNKARKDSYSSLMLAAWGLKSFFDMKKKVEKPSFFWEPRLIG